MKPRSRNRRSFECHLCPLGRGAEGLDTVYREKLRLVPKNEIEGRLEKIPLE